MKLMRLIKCFLSSAVNNPFKIHVVIDIVHRVTTGHARQRLTER